MNLETKITIYKFTPQLFTLTPEVPFLFLSENIFLYVFRVRKRIPLMNSIIFVRLLSDCFKSKEDKRL
jgi:hypothetical protein